MGELFDFFHTGITNLIGSHPRLLWSILAYGFIIGPALTAFLKTAFPKSATPTGRDLITRPEVQVILQRSFTTPADQEAVIDALIRIISPPTVRPPLVAGLLAALGVVTNFYAWIWQRIGITPPSVDVGPSSVEIPRPGQGQ